MHEQFFYSQLRERGYAGTAVGMWRNWLASKGIPFSDIQDMETKWLRDQGYVGTHNDMRFKFYRDHGLTGVLDDMGRKWIVPEGGTGPDEGEPVEDPMWADVLFFHDFTSMNPVTGGTGAFVSTTSELIDEGIFGYPAMNLQPVNNRVSGLKCTIPDVKLGTVEGFTVDCWGKTIDIGPGRWPTWMELYNGSDTSYYGSSDGRGFTTGGVFGYHPSGENSIPHDEWTHVAYVFGDGRVKIYSEGVMIHDSGLSDITAAFNSVMIGSRHNSSNPYVFKGKLSQVRITKGMRWTEDFTPPTGPVKVPTP